MEAYSNASAQELTLMHDALHFNDCTRASVPGRAMMVMPLPGRPGRQRKALWFREPC